MGFSAHPQIIIGIEASEIVSEKTEVETYEIHDQRGKKTGQMGKEETTVFSAVVNGKEKTITDGVHSESISDLLDIEDYPNTSNFGIIDTVFEGEHSLESCIIGVPVLEIDLMYGERIENIGLVEIAEATQEVKTKCKEMFNKDVEPKIFLYGNSGY